MSSYTLLMLDINQFVYDMRDATEVDEAFALFRRHLDAMGFDMALYSLLTDFRSIGLKAGHGVLYNYPQEWMDWYFERSYQEIDPVIQLGFRARDAFDWAKMDQMMPYTDAQATLMHESREAGLLQGVGVAVHGPCGEVLAMGMASSHGGVDVSPPRLAILRMMVQEFNNAFVRIHAQAQRCAPVELTPRELQVLRWLARGKTVPEISIILSVEGSVGETTVRFHVRNLYAKLEAATAAQAVAKALSLGCLTFVDLNGYV